MGKIIINYTVIIKMKWVTDKIFYLIWLHDKILSLCYNQRTDSRTSISFNCYRFILVLRCDK